MSSEKNPTSNVIQLPTNPQPGTRLNDEKWGRGVMALGYCVMPWLLLEAQARLKITPSELAILLHLVDHWWKADALPFPAKRRLADRMSISQRQVQRHLAALERKALIKRVERRLALKGQSSNFYDLSGLVQRLREIEPEFTQQRKEAESARARLRRPGLKRRITSKPSAG